jgi:hypothetical protein
MKEETFWQVFKEFPKGTIRRVGWQPLHDNRAEAVWWAVKCIRRGFYKCWHELYIRGYRIRKCRIVPIKRGES